MKIYDCTTFYSEHMMMDVRFSILDKYVEKFIVTESLYSHSGKRKELNLMDQKNNKELDFNEIDERLAAGWYVFSGQRKRYLKSISKKK